MVDAVLVEEVVDSFFLHGYAEVSVDSFEDRATRQAEAVVGETGVDEDAGPREVGRE